MALPHGKVRYSTNESPVMTSYVVMRYALWSRPLILGCLFLWLQALLSPLLLFLVLFPPLIINLNEILVLRQF
jgi:hypothetical protein